MTAAKIRYSYSTPEECREHLRTFWERHGRKDWRIRFAWRPVRLWEQYQSQYGGSFVRPSKDRVWWKPVVEVRTLWGNWVAYADIQMALRDAHGQLGDKT